MKTPLASLPLSNAGSAPRRRRRRAFSLVEVTLALGIVTFALVAVVGVLPTALASGRQSFDQNRAAAIANTLFASFRSQPFDKVGYVDAQFDATGATLSGSGPKTVNLNDPLADPPSPFYAKFLNVATESGDTSDAFGAQRRLMFTDAQPIGGADYSVAMNFYKATTVNGVAIPASNQPEGMVTTGQACRVELVINSVTKPDSKYRFVSTVFNRPR